MRQGENSHSGWKEQSQAEKTCEIPGHKGDCTMEMPMRPRKSKLKEAMKNTVRMAEDAPLQEAEAAKPGIYAYVYVSVCVCSCLM